MKYWSSSQVNRGKSWSTITHEKLTGSSYINASNRSREEMTHCSEKPFSRDCTPAVPRPVQLQTGRRPALVSYFRRSPNCVPVMRWQPAEEDRRKARVVMRTGGLRPRWSFGSCYCQGSLKVFTTLTNSRYGLARPPLGIDLGPFFAASKSLVEGQQNWWSERRVLYSRGKHRPRHLRKRSWVRPQRVSNQITDLEDRRDVVHVFENCFLPRLWWVRSFEEFHPKCKWRLHYLSRSMEYKRKKGEKTCLSLFAIPIYLFPLTWSSFHVARTVKESFSVSRER